MSQKFKIKMLFGCDESCVSAPEGKVQHKREIEHLRVSVGVNLRVSVGVRVWG